MNFRQKRSKIIFFSFLIIIFLACIIFQQEDVEIKNSSEKKDINIVKITLNVGLATFKPIRVEKVKDHKMLEENYSISPSASKTIEKAKNDGRKTVMDRDFS